ncbi:hypothetical protein [Streptococcus caballi]|uniref:hypothetical protein n=1 Tax=Streptococcus caballi TaxID=439220 RepID=UPI000363333B|nr:hypothetical protein [Streptococcus caballi]
MKKLLTHIFASTGISLIVLAVAALLLKAHWLLLVTIFQVLLVNILIHLSLLAKKKFELKSALISSLLDIIIIEGILFVSSKPFDWNADDRVLLLIGFLVYVASQALDLFDLSQEAQEINALIKRRRR